MDGQFGHPRGRQLLAELAVAFRKKPVFRRKDVHILFVCGGPLGADADTMRAQFLPWARDNLPQCVVLLAESAFRSTLSHDPPEAVNLAVFEGIIAEVSDCVLIFPESTGSFAEIGFFSNSKIRKKTLVANDYRYQTSDSFANLGPIDTINTYSYLKPAIHLNRNGGLIDFEPVGQRLKRVLERSNRARINCKTYGDLSYDHKLAVMLEIIRTLRAVTVSSLYVAVKSIFGACKTSELKRLLSILVAAEYIAPVDEYFIIDAEKSPLAEFEGFDSEALSARAVFYYRKYRPTIYSIIGSAS